VKKKKKKKRECFKRNTKELKSENVKKRKKKREFFTRNTKERVKVIMMLWCGNGKETHQRLSEI